jgi:hypothetical protein
MRAGVLSRTISALPQFAFFGVKPKINETKESAWVALEDVRDQQDVEEIESQESQYSDRKPKRWIFGRSLNGSHNVSEPCKERRVTDQ